MKYFFILLSLFVFTANAQGRKPAVEDFVGVEPAETYEEAVSGNENQYFYDFGKKVSARHPANSDVLNLENNFWSKWSGLIGFFLFVSLPFALWGAIRAMGPQIKTNSTKEPLHTSTSVANLDDYRNKSDNDKDHKKAS